MKIFCFVFLFFSTVVGNAQNIEVTYTVSSNDAYFEQRKNEYAKKKGATPSPAFQKKMRETMALFKYIEYTLVIDNSASIFYMNEALTVDNSNLKEVTARIIAGFNSELYFSDAKTHEKLRQTDAYGQQYLIASPMDALEWTITEETKMIHGFKTYKAYASEFDENSFGTHKIIVNAWFAPKLSYPFGPGAYGNLPGLILELRRSGKIYQVEKIEKTKEQVLRPTEGKKISKAEFLKIGRKMSERR